MDVTDPVESDLAPIPALLSQIPGPRPLWWVKCCAVIYDAESAAEALPTLLRAVHGATWSTESFLSVTHTADITEHDFKALRSKLYGV
jgi:hypothetical protein